jgi:hypothetical protein
MRFFHHKQQDNPEGMKKKNFIRRLGKNPYRDWLVILIFTVITVLAFLFDSAWVYINVESKLDQVDIKKATGTYVTIDKALLQKTIDNYELRSQQREKIQKGYEGPSDPSI